MAHAILRDILIIFAVSVPVVLAANRLRIPTIVGFLITGVLIGPHAAGFIPDVAEIQVLAEVGVALLLFSIGLEFSFDRLKGWGRQALAMGAIQVLVTIAAGLAASTSAGGSISDGAFLGCAIALSSTAIVMVILSQRRWFDAPAGRIAIGMLILQDLAVVPMMVFLQFTAGGHDAHPLVALGWALLHVVGLAAGLFILSRWVLRPLLHHIAAPGSKELFVVVVVGLAIGASYVTQQLGLSFALGAFLAGVLVSTTEFRFHALSEIAPFRYCMSGLFFVSLGMIVDPSFIAGHLQAVAALVAFILIAKTLITGGTIFAFGYPLSVAAIGGLMLAQVGEFSFMLVFFGHQGGALSDDLYHLIVAASAITMVAAPFIVAAAPAIGERLAFVPWKFARPRHKREEPQQSEKLSGHAIICGFGPLGMTIGGLLERRRVPYVILELNPTTAARMKEKGHRVYIGDGASSVLLHHSGIEQAKLLAIAVPDHLNALAILKQARRMNSTIFIITRSRYRDQVQRFYEAGADVVVCEELEAGIEMGRYVLESLAVASDEVAAIVEDLRAFGSADFF
jgi:monovalent cation:H+ antiporter-2, CPA2 family